MCTHVFRDICSSCALCWRSMRVMPSACLRVLLQADVTEAESESTGLQEIRGLKPGEWAEVTTTSRGTRLFYAFTLKAGEAVNLPI